MKKYLLSLFVFLFVFCFGIAFAENVKIGEKSLNLPDGFMLVDSSNDVNTYMNINTCEAIGIGGNNFDSGSNIDLDMSSDLITNLMKEQLAKSNMNVVNNEVLNIAGKKISLLKCNSSVGDALVAYYAEHGYLYMFIYMQMDMNTQKSIVDYNRGKSFIISLISSMH